MRISLWSAFSAALVLLSSCGDKVDDKVARGTAAVYEDNVVKKTIGEGILVVQGGNTFRGNKVSGSTDVDLQSNVAEDQNTLDDNRFGTQSFP